MRTFATPTCNEPGNRVGAYPRAVGFTLLEVLLVVTIIGILASVVMLSATDIGRQRAIRAEAERLALAVELARDEARLRNAVWGLAVDGGAYRFRTYDQARDEWHDVERREFGADATEEDIEFVVGPAFESTDGHRAELAWNEGGGGRQPDMMGVGTDDEARSPDVVIYPGGEVTPFRITVSGGEAYPAWVAHSDGIQRTRAIAETEVAEVDDDLGDWLRQEGLAQ